MRSGLLWVTHGKDLPWFERSAKSYKKFASGWEWAKCVVPNPDVPAFQPVCEANGILLVGFDEWEGKGFNHHQMMVCYGDNHFPEADVIFHIDADCVFASPCTPDDWLPGGKVLIPFTDYKHFLTAPIRVDEEKHFMGFTGRVVDFNRAQYWWKWASEFALGFETPRECMSWMPLPQIREVYSKARGIVEERFKQPFQDYVFTCRNEFPQNFCEHNFLSAVAYKFFEDRYHWQDLHLQGHAFAGKVIQCWSHGGFDRGHDFAREVGGYQTPRQLFERLGIL